MAKRPLLGLALLAVSSAAVATDDDPICADRPGKATPTCIVPAGMLQIETGLVDWARDRSGGFRVDALAIGASAIKLGINDRLHVELDLSPYVQERARGGGISDSISGFGDSALAMKYRLTDANAPVQLALRPFVMIPTGGHRLGNGKVEGGVALLADGALGRDAGWNVAPELDLIADSDGSGYHVATTQAVSVGFPVTNRLTVSGELWGAWDFDPAGTVRQYSVDGAAAFLLSPNIQLDAGVNLGLNRATPDLEIYSGIALRF
jgi:hypothetical protein